MAFNRKKRNNVTLFSINLIKLKTNYYTSNQDIGD